MPNSIYKRLKQTTSSVVSYITAAAQNKQRDFSMHSHILNAQLDYQFQHHSFRSWSAFLLAASYIVKFPLIFPVVPVALIAYFILPPPLFCDQTIILSKLSKFLRLTNDNETKSLQEALKEGHCFGFSVCHAAMDAIGKLAWWEAALLAVVNWDGTKESLERKVFLPQAESAQTLREIFERVLNYVVYHQMNSLKEQASLFDSASNLFEISDAGQIKKLSKNSKSSLGSFNSEQLNAFLKDEMPPAMLIARSGAKKHAIRIGYKPEEKLWFVYDPNYGISVKENVKLYKNFETKQAMVKEINAILGSNVEIRKGEIDHKPSGSLAVNDEKYKDVDNHKKSMEEDEADDDHEPDHFEDAEEVAGATQKKLSEKEKMNDSEAEDIDDPDEGEDNDRYEEAMEVDEMTKRKEEKQQHVQDKQLDDDEDDLDEGHDHFEEASDTPAKNMTFRK